MYWFLFICAGMLSSGGTSKNDYIKVMTVRFLDTWKSVLFFLFFVFLNVLCVYTLGLNDWFNVLI